MKLSTCTLLLIAASIAPAQETATIPAAHATPMDSVRRGLVLGVDGSYNARRGYLEISGFRQDTAAKPLLLGGFWVGLRAHNDSFSWLRRQLTVSLDFGSVDFDTIHNVPLSDGTVQDQVALTQDFFHVGINPELQFVLPASDIFKPHLSIGIGLNYLRFRELGRVNNGGSLFRQAVSLVGGAESTKWCFDARGGVGLDFALGRNGGFLTIGYSFTYWQPVSYTFDRDLPLHGFPYWETFRSHEVALGVGWGG